MNIYIDFQYEKRIVIVIYVATALKLFCPELSESKIINIYM